MNLFKSKPDDVTTIRQKIHATQAEISNLEDEFDDASTDAAASGDYGPAELISAQLKAAHLKVEVLHRAEAAEQRAEAARAAEARQKEQKARTRAFRSHAARLQTAAGEFEIAVTALARAWRSIVDAAGQATAVMPPGINGAMLSPTSLRKLGELELARIGHLSGHLGAEPDLPGSSAGFTYLVGRAPHTLPPLSEEIAQSTARLVNPPDMEPVGPGSPVTTPGLLTPGSEEWLARQNGWPTAEPGRRLEAANG